MANILIIAYTTYISDARVKRHAEALVRRGDDVDLICLEAEQRTELNGVNLIALPIPRYRGRSRLGYLRSYGYFMGRAAWLAAGRSLKRRYDLVIVCSIPDLAVLCALGPKLLGARLLLDVHDTMPELYRERFDGVQGALGARLLMVEERTSARMADAVLAVHDAHARRLVEAGIPDKKIRVVLNAPDPRYFAPVRDGRVESGSFTLVCHGTISRRLGVDVALHALALLRRRFPAIRLKVVGVGDHKEQACALAETLDLGSQVSFHHRVPVERVRDVLAEASAGLVPNLASSATHMMLPVKLLEFATMGIPIIAARLRTIEQYFAPDSVRYFEPGDPASLAEAIEDLYLNPDRCAGLARRAHEIAETLNWNNQRRNFFGAVDALLAG